MKKSVFLYCAMLAMGFFVLSGCVTVGDSPNSRFYMLKHINADKVGQRFEIPSGTITVIGPVSIPQYLDRPQMVTEDERGMMNIAQFDRWGESLDAGIAQLIIENLDLKSSGGTFEMFPCNFAIPLDYQVLVGIQQLRANLKKDLVLAAQWSIIQADTRKMLLAKYSEIVVPVKPHNYSGLADALSEAVGSLTTEIAENLSVLASQQEKIAADQIKK